MTKGPILVSILTRHHLAKISSLHIPEKEREKEETLNAFEKVKYVWV
jgi:hypothetical protein